EIIRGLKAQDFLRIDGKHIVPTERGLQLFAVLEQADPALVDPGVTAQLERLLDEVLVGQQEMMGAIDAVCAQASRIIARLTERAASGEVPLLADGVAAGGGKGAPTPAMARFVASLAQRKGIAPPRGYTRSVTACRAFLDEHAPRREGGEAGTNRAPSPAQLGFARKLAEQRGMALPEEAQASAAAISAWIDGQQGKKPGRGKAAGPGKGRPRKLGTGRAPARRRSQEDAAPG
ncbi:MAG: DNA topoisomerase III, partial [Azospirillum brasilense]